MFRFNATGLMAALVLAVAGLSGGCITPENPCSDVECDEGESCNRRTGVCEPDEGCTADSECDATETCETSTGRCLTRCESESKPRGGSECSATQKCVPTTGECVAKCAGVTCDASQKCIETTGECSAKCESATKPLGKPECGSQEKCEAATGECVSKCKDLRCPFGQWCDPSGTAKCTGGKAPDGFPGTACGDDSECNVPGQPLTQSFECMTALGGGFQLPGGYCVASCTTASDCPYGSTCISELGACFAQCTKDSDCGRTNYRCQNIGGSYGFACFPAEECTKGDACAPVGGDCDADSDCISGALCIEEMSAPRTAGAAPEYSGFDGGYCLWVKRATDPYCPPGSVSVPVDNTVHYCMKGCTVGDIEACSQGETCLQLQANSSAGVCWSSQCSADTDCQRAACTATDVRQCGRGQKCEQIVNGRGTCATRDTCTTDNDCRTSSGVQLGECVAGLCVDTFCDPVVGQCKYDCRLSPTEICGTEATCNEDSGACEFGCIDDTACGPNGVCAGGTCLARCTIHNEKDVCPVDAPACNLATGKCQPKCTAGSCGDGEVCETKAGRCLPRCDLAGSPACGGTKICNDFTGLCQENCAGKESSVCDPLNSVKASRTYCQSSTGKCLPDCESNPSICGSEACSIDDSTAVGRCGRSCTSAAQACGRGPAYERLRCDTTAKRCVVATCAGDVTCPANSTCREATCFNVCTGTSDKLLPGYCATDFYCPAGSNQTCARRCDAASNPSDCGEDETCNASGICE